MRVIFSRQCRPSSFLIRLFTWSQWSHVSILEDEDHIIDSTFKHGGVRRRPVLELVGEVSAFEVVEVPLPMEDAGMDFIRSQLGKPYDWTAIVGFILRENWADPAKWFCNELFEAGCKAGGRLRFRESLSRVTPRHSWMVR